MNKRTYSTPSGKISYWINYNNFNQPTLVFLPGLTANHHLFDKQIKFFENKYNLFVWDPPGHGKSIPFKLNFSLRDKAHWLNEILNLEQIEKPILIGQSMGGHLSQMFLHEFPDKAIGFISIDSSSLNRNYYTKLELDLLKWMEPVYRLFPWKLLLITGPIGCAETKYGRKLMREMTQEYSGNHSYYAQLVGHGFKILAQAIEEKSDFNVDCPCLLICGEKDKAGSAKYYNRKWHQKTGIPLKWISGAGHNSNTDQPELINLLIELFTEKLRI